MKTTYLYKELTMMQRDENGRYFAEQKDDGSADTQSPEPTYLETALGRTPFYAKVSCHTAFALTGKAAEQKIDISVSKVSIEVNDPRAEFLVDQTRVRSLIARIIDAYNTLLGYGKLVGSVTCDAQATDTQGSEEAARDVHDEDGDLNGTKYPVI